MTAWNHPQLIHEDASLEPVNTPFNLYDRWAVLMLLGGKKVQPLEPNIRKTYICHIITECLTR